MTKFTMLFTYETEDAEGNVVGSEEGRASFTHHRARPAFTPRGEFAPIDPPEPEAIEIQSIEIEVAPFDNKHWRDTTDDEFEIYNDYLIENRWDCLIQEAQND